MKAVKIARLASPAVMAMRLSLISADLGRPRIVGAVDERHRALLQRHADGLDRHAGVDAAHHGRGIDVGHRVGRRWRRVAPPWSSRCLRGFRRRGRRPCRSPCRAPRRTARARRTASSSGETETCRASGRWPASRPLTWQQQPQPSATERYLSAFHRIVSSLRFVFVFATKLRFDRANQNSDWPLHRARLRTRWVTCHGIKKLSSNSTR